MDTRLIPAHAGKTNPLLSMLLRARAHPRSRGENRCKAADRRAWAGSSPLTRGKLCRMPQAFPSAGLIPAHAGKTATARPLPRASWAHPRSRGENAMSARQKPSGYGSSPLTRGKLGSGVNDPEGPGLIPAHAGKTLWPRCGVLRPRAHPRSRGENFVGIRFSWSARGSSPLTRGKRRTWRGSASRSRLIPAHAGKTANPKTPCGGFEAHPRSRGENAALTAFLKVSLGSSPLTRGKLAWLFVFR